MQVLHLKPRKRHQHARNEIGLCSLYPKQERYRAGAPSSTSPQLAQTSTSRIFTEYHLKRQVERRQAENYQAEYHLKPTIACTANTMIPRLHLGEHIAPMPLHQQVYTKHEVQPTILCKANFLTHKLHLIGTYQH